MPKTLNKILVFHSFGTILGLCRTTSSLSWACSGPVSGGCPETPQKSPSASCIVFCKEFVPPRRPQDTPGGAPKTTRCILYCFLQGICSPKTTPRRPKAILYCFLQAFWGVSWAISGLSWSIVDLSWAMLGHLGPVLGLSSACLGPVFGHLRPVLGLSWGCPGTSWACFGLSWDCDRLSWAVLGLSYLLKLFWKA